MGVENEIVGNSFFGPKKGNLNIGSKNWTLENVDNLDRHCSGERKEGERGSRGGLINIRTTN